MHEGSNLLLPLECFYVEENTQNPQSRSIPSPVCSLPILQLYCLGGILVVSVCNCRPVGLCMISHHRGSGTLLLIGILGQISEAQTSSLLLIERANKTLTIATAAATHTDAAMARSPGFHAHARLKAGYHIRPGSIASVAPCERLGAVGITSAKVKQVHTREGDKEAAYQGQRVDDVGSIETTKQDERGAKRRGCECDVV
jgi:hypothetical protein